MSKTKLKHPNDMTDYEKWQYAEKQFADSRKYLLKFIESGIRSKRKLTKEDVFNPWSAGQHLGQLSFCQALAMSMGEFEIASECVTLMSKLNTWIEETCKEQGVDAVVEGKIN